MAKELPPNERAHPSLDPADFRGELERVFPHPFSPIGARRRLSPWQRRCMNFP